MNERKLAFYEIGKNGNYAAEMQIEFENAQQLSIETGKSIKVISTIIIEPPKGRDRFGQISFKVKTQAPERASIKYTTEVSNGVIVATAENEVAILQESMNLEMPQIVPEEVRKGNGQ